MFCRCREVRSINTTFESHTVVISPLPATNSRCLADIFEHFSAKPWSVLFDTAGSKQSKGRYNIMVWDPALTCEAKDGMVTLTNAASGEFTEYPDTPLEVARQAFHELFAGVQLSACSRQHEHLPFMVGVAGLAGYDLGRYYETLPSRAEGGYACPDLALGFYEQSLIEDTQTGIIYHCRLSHIAPFHPVTSVAKGSDFKLTSGWQANLSQHDYTTALNKIDDYLRAGDCYQINMAQRFQASYQGDEWQAYCHLRDTNQAPFSAFMRLPNSAVLSISPERFLSVREGVVETKPIKGTRPRYADPQQDQESAQSLLMSEKDQAENLMIVDLLRNDISKNCQDGSVEVPHLFKLESYAAVHHMVSTVTGKLNDGASPLELLAGAFPGGSITGAPKVRAMEIIDELEPHRRNIYCGSMLYMGFREDMDSSICIRTLLAENHHLYCWAGGGIVLDSNPADEYQETLDKVARILPELTTFRDQS
ncbi:aminodeoxychorismate synthase component I [Alteromonas sp. ASW11-19]|uniref:aminodeoxychorismate synthase n=1 Tax=Alteromonas salexigens TaxID=2982530 RepID=A0ABT2VLK9_9ALTE|nr:aminodeoxychorismate synthase component I [Alteromonas salexigens]MCU7554193.1 aminodeoxychorismate synthase component I [Alteromonas salexigens]